MKNINPDLQRYLWEEFSRKRMAIGIFVTLLLILIACLITRDGNFVEYLYKLFNIVQFFIIVTFLIATSKVASSLPDEYQNHTWQQHQMSCLTPWQLIWGKIIGAGSYWLFINVIFLATLIIIAVLIANHNLNFDYFYKSVKVLVTGILIIIVGFWLGLILSERRETNTRSTAIILFMVMLFFGYGLIEAVVNDNNTFAFYNFEFDSTKFYIVNCLVFSVWFLLANVRQMKKRLTVPQLAWATPLFVIFISSWILGIFIEHLEENKLFIWLSLNLYISAIIVYFSLVLDPPSQWLINKIYQKAKNENWGAACKIMPNWVSLFILAIIFTILIVIFAPFETTTFSIEKSNSLIAVNVLLMLFRDGLIFAVCYYNNHKRAFLSVFTTLFLINFLLPWIFGLSEMTVLFNIVFPLVSISENSDNLNLEIIQPFILLIHITIVLAIYFFIAKTYDKSQATVTAP